MQFLMIFIIFRVVFEAASAALSDYSELQAMIQLTASVAFLTSDNIAAQKMGNQVLHYILVIGEAPPATDWVTACSSTCSG